MTSRVHGRAVRDLGRGRPPLPVPPCPVCDATEARPRFEIDGVGPIVVECPGCGLGRLQPMPSPEEVAAYYPDEYYGDAGTKFEGPVELLVRLVGARHLRFLVGGLPPGARVLDVGCGRGVLLTALAELGFEAHGTELSAAATRGAAPGARIRIAPSLAAVAHAAESFDEVIIWHVLEHLRDPAGTIAEARRLLRPGGALVVALPNFGSLQARWAGADWFHLDPPRHLWHFPAAALRRLLERERFAIASEHHVSLRQNPFGWLQSALNKLPGLPRNGLYELLHARAPGAPAPFDPLTRLALRACQVAGTPAALALSALEAALRDGGTVCLVARRT